jgi:hypothetical protein
MSFGRAPSELAGAAFLMLFALPVPASAAAASSFQAGETAPPAPHMVMLYFYRLQAFHDMAVQRDCRRAFPDRTRALNGRYEALRRRVDAFAGTAAGERRGDAKGGQSGPGGDCDSGLLLGYEDKLVTLERYLSGSAG